MLTEVHEVRQAAGEPLRRWFSDEEFDLIVWYEDAGGVMGFQLCYRADDDEKALTWMAGRGFSHNRVDDGDSFWAHHKMTPILVADGTFDRDRVSTRFLAVAKEIDADVVRLVSKRLQSYPAGQAIRQTPPV